MPAGVALEEKIPWLPWLPQEFPVGTKSRQIQALFKEPVLESAYQGLSASKIREPMTF